MIRVDMKRIVTRYIPSIQTNIIYKVGKNAQDNFDLIDKAQPNDLWFHLKDEPSCHVIACLKNITFNTRDDEMPNFYNIEFEELDKKQKQQIITQGALVCKQFSKFKNKKNVDFIYTKIKYVHKTETLGSVLAHYTKTITV
jgi:predicted ribosome quality control (RQC) complex YloA/Tae2 family protein